MFSQLWSHVDLRYSEHFSKTMSLWNLAILQWTNTLSEIKVNSFIFQFLIQNMETSDICGVAPPPNQ